ADQKLREFKLLEQRIGLFEKGNNSEKLIKSLQKQFGLKPQHLTNRAESGRLMRLRLQQMEDNLRKRKVQTTARLSGFMRELWKNANILYRVAPKLGYHSYMAGHLSQVLLQFPGPYRDAIASEKEIVDFLIKVSVFGTKNNTNPESAYSRLSSLYYTLGTSNFNRKNYKQAYTYFQKALAAVSESINYDRLYFDTNRIKSLFLLEKFCDMDKSKQSLDVAAKILRTSIMGTAKNNLRPYPNYYWRIAQAYFESVAKSYRNKNMGELAKTLKGLTTTIHTAIEITKETAEFDRRRFVGKNPEKQMAQERMITQLDGVLGSLDRSMKTMASMDLTSVRPFLEELSKIMGRFMGPKRPPVYGRCMANLKLMKGE
ncbi:hypothetical protein KJ865_01155, partial [Myxococcota bacterium]|nr:hypothetical protein [Myxococcota bacterium]